MKTKEEIEKSLSEELDELIDGYNTSISDYTYDPEKKTYTVVFDIHEVPEDDYIGLMNY